MHNVHMHAVYIHPMDMHAVDQWTCTPVNLVHRHPVHMHPMRMCKVCKAAEVAEAQLDAINSGRAPVLAQIGSQVIKRNLKVSMWASWHRHVGIGRCV